jgi:hypothetical protein
VRAVETPTPTPAHLAAAPMKSNPPAGAMTPTLDLPPAPGLLRTVVVTALAMAAAAGPEDARRRRLSSEPTENSERSRGRSDIT